MTTTGTRSQVGQSTGRPGEAVRIIGTIAETEAAAVGYMRVELNVAALTAAEERRWYLAWAARHRHTVHDTQARRPSGFPVAVWARLRELPPEDAYREYLGDVTVRIR